MIEDKKQEILAEFRKKFVKHKLFAKGAFGFEIEEIEAFLSDVIDRVFKEAHELGRSESLEYEIDRVKAETVKERDEEFVKTAIVEIEAHLPFENDTFSNGRLTGMRDAIDILSSLTKKDEVKEEVTET